MSSRTSVFILMILQCKSSSTDIEIVKYMGRLRKCFGKGIPVGCSEDAGDSDAAPFVPNDFAEDDDYPFSEDGDMDDAEFDKDLYDLYVTHKVNRLKRKLSCAAARNVKFKRSSDFPSASTFTRYSGKLFSSCIAGLSPRQVNVIQSYGADCLLNIKKFKDSTKVASKRSVTFGGCHYAFAVSYLDNVHFGLNALPDIKPRILVWRGNKVKHFSDLDKCNSRSYGKRPLKRLSPSLYAPKSCEKFSCSRGRDAATSKIPFANNTTTSEVNAPAGSNVSFASKVESAYASCLGIEVVKQIIDLVQKSNADKPINFQDWSESLVLNVLGLIGDSKFKSPVRSCAKYPLGSKADSPTFKNSGSDDLPGCKSVPIQSTKKASDDPSVSKLARIVMSDDCAKTNLSIPPLGTFAAPPSIVPPAPVSGGSSPTTSLFAMPVAMPTSIPSGSPLKRCKPNVGLISNVRPSMHRFKSDCASKDDLCVKKADQIFRSARVDFEFHPDTRNHSPLLPVRLSQRFIDDGGVLMVALPPSNNSNPVQSSNKNHVDLTSPEALNEFFNGRDDVVGIDEVQIVGTSIFSDRCVNFTKKTNEAYNQLNKLASSSSFSLGAVNSPEVLIISDPDCVAKLKAAHQHNISITSKVSDCSTSTIQHVPRRIVGATRFNSDPYVQQMNRFPLTLQERKHYFAMNRIDKDDVLCKYEAIRYDRAFCSYRSLASLCPNGHIDNSCFYVSVDIFSTSVILLNRRNISSSVMLGHVYAILKALPQGNQFRRVQGMQYRVWTRYVDRETGDNMSLATQDRDRIEDKCQPVIGYIFR
ncbi:hypothetical protein ZWY2020_053824 [Hordeum vulgare]|nr:hypothetical protein ZWY2020_053824 [Hordeum vulgare]